METSEQLDFVRSYCVSIQGYLYSTPLAVGDVTDLLRRDNLHGIDWGRLGR